MKRKMLICLTLILSLNYASAVKVSPVRYDLSITRGSSKEFVLNLMGSKGFSNQDLMIYPSDLFMSRSGALSFDSRKSKNSCVNWIKIEKSKLSLLGTQAKNVKFKISIPADAIPGEYYAVIMVEPNEFTKVSDKKNPMMIKMKSRVAVVVVLDVPGRTYEKKGEAIDLNILETNKFIRIGSTFKNSGNIHLDVSAEAVIKSIDGKENFGKFDIKAVNSSKTESFIFPGALRDFGGVLKRQLPGGDYLVDVAYNYGYSFKKAHQIKKFTVIRKGTLDEKNSEFINLDNRELKLSIPVGATRTQIIKVTNLDYRAINVITESSDWIKINPKTFSLKPGEAKNIQAIISVSDYKEAIKKASVVFRPNRGKAIILSVDVIKPGTPNIKELLQATSVQPQATTDPQMVTEGGTGKKLEQPQPASKDSQLVGGEANNKKINSNTNDKAIKNLPDVKQASKWDADSHILYIGLGLIGLVIIILLIILIIRNTGKSAKN